MLNMFGKIFNRKPRWWDDWAVGTEGTQVILQLPRSDKKVVYIECATKDDAVLLSEILISAMVALK